MKAVSEVNWESAALSLDCLVAPERSEGTSEDERRLAPAVAEAGAIGATGHRRWRRPLLGIPLAALVSGLGLGRGYIDLDRPILEREHQRGEVLRRERIFRRSLVMADLIAVTIAMLLCVTVVGHRALEPLAVLVLPLVVFAGKLVGIYDRDDLVIHKATIDEAPRLFQLATLFALLFSIFETLFVSPRLAAAQLALLWFALFVFALIARGIARTFARTIAPVERCLFVGTEASGDRLDAKLASTGEHAILVGRISIGDGGDQVDPAEAATVLHRLVDELRVHRVVIEPSEPQPQSTLDFVREAKGTGARVSLLPRILDVVGSSIEVDDVHGLTLLGVRRYGLSRSSAFVKRSLDVAGSGLGLLLISPLLALLALLVRFDSRGAAIYRQTRVGRDGRTFTMFKLRTMVDGADALKPALLALNESDGLFKIAADPRITRAGKWLRRYSLDELPQLFNVLRGEMSLVGPRPLVAEDDARIMGLDRRRLALTPGMTGRWQILGSSQVPLAEMIKLDYLYVTGWSLWSDVKILLLTVPYVFARRGM